MRTSIGVQAIHSTDRDVPDVAVVVLVVAPPRRRRGRSASMNSGDGLPNAVRWYSHSR